MSVHAGGGARSDDNNNHPRLSAESGQKIILSERGYAALAVIPNIAALPANPEHFRVVPNGRFVGVFPARWWRFCFRVFSPVGRK